MKKFYARGYQEGEYFQVDGDTGRELSDELDQIGYFRELGPLSVYDYHGNCVGSVHVDQHQIDSEFGGQTQFVTN